MDILVCPASTKKRKKKLKGESMSLGLFDFTGFAARTDLDENDFKVSFDRLEQEQSEFLKYEHNFRSKDYQ